MPSLDERVAYLEGRLEDQSGTVVILRDDIRLGIERLGGRFSAVDTRFDRLEARMDRLDARLDRLENRMDRLDEKVSRHFTWLVGIQVTVLVAVIGALLGR